MRTPALVAVFLALLLAAPAGAVPACPISYGSHDDAKPNKLYMYYPAAADSTFPEFGAVGGGPTSPATPFDVSQLTSYTGTANALRDATNDVVIDDFCEFNVQVRPTDTAPPATFPRRVTIAVGTESEPGGRWGRANLVDVGDPTDLGFARLWAGTYQNSAGFPGGALEGVNSTVARWANAIGGTAAHEAGHTYGLSHNTITAPGEDIFGRHLMPAGSAVTQEQRAGYRRHFSNNEFATLAANVGLSIQTMHNWDLVNPNAQTASQFRLTFLSPQASPILSWSYGGPSSPWINPTVTSNGTQSFKGTTYNRFRLTWSAGKMWNGGASGVVPGGAEFHVGATFSGVDFNEPDPIIITKSELLDSDGDPLALQPRLFGYDAGEIDSDDGSYAIDFSNFVAEDLQLTDVEIQLLPRVVGIDSMLPGVKTLRDFAGERFLRYKNSRHGLVKKPRTLTRKRGMSLTVAKMSRDRQVFEEVTESQCNTGDAPSEPDAASCTPGTTVSLFPATTLYLKATVVDPDAKVWNAKKKRYLTRPLASRIFYQLGGIRPDLNKNDVDDFLDIRNGTSNDFDFDGVPDEAQRRGR